MKKYVQNVIELIEEKACVSLTEEQAIDLINDSGYEDEIVEFNGETIWDTAPRETLVAVLCKKITGRESWSYGEIAVDPEGYDAWLESFVRLAPEKGYELTDG